MNKMLSDKLFLELISMASMAPSADNMQAWEFRNSNEGIEVYCAKSRILPTDVNCMFAWIGVGAVIENLVLAASAYGFTANVQYNEHATLDNAVAIIHLNHQGNKIDLADWIQKRTTNRSAYYTSSVNQEDILAMNKSVGSLNAGIYWNTSPTDMKRLVLMDAKSTYIRLEHKPLHDELFEILRFSHKDVAKYGFGLDFRSLEVPSIAVFFARLLQYWTINQVVSRLGIGKAIARKLASRIPQSGALCLVTAKTRDKFGYIEAGRAMEQVWLTATSQGLSVQPYGVLPQYITKAEVEPETLLPQYVEAINAHREPFFSIFPGSESELPAIVLRIGRTGKQSIRSDFRLKPEQLIRK